MRSIQVHLIDTKGEEIRAALSAFGRQATSGQWLYPPAAQQPSLYIEFFTDFSAFEPEDLAVLQQALGRQPDVSVIADVSGRVPGEADVRAFVECLLTRFQGVTRDEFSPHCWTLLEIRSNAKVAGHHFFDYDGWYRDTTAI